MTDTTGKMITAKASASSGYSDRPADVLCSNAGMGGDGGAFQTHSDELDCMWISVRNPLPEAYLEFDLGRPEAISTMHVWNFGQPESTAAGMRAVRIFTSCNHNEWAEFVSPQSPFILARADGEPTFQATNLDDGTHSPVHFDGLTARYVRIQALDGIGIGCWGEYIEGQYRHGLSAVRFFAYKPQTAFGSYIPALTYCTDSRTPEEKGLMNISNGWGLSDPGTPEALLTDDPQTMWLSTLCPLSGEIIFDLEGTYPIGEMHIWNYNEPGNTAAGLKNVRIYYAIGFSDWKELKGDGYPYIFRQAPGVRSKATNLVVPESPAANLVAPEPPAANLVVPEPQPVRFANVRARYIKIVPSGPCGEGTWGTYNGFEQRYGLGKVRIYTGEGYCMEPDYRFTSLLSNYNGWSGADGILMVPSDGIEKQLPEEDAAARKTIVIFSDTFYGRVNPVTRQRSRYTVLNNSSAEFYGNHPAALDFRIRTSPEGKPDSLIPNPGDGRYFYWLQDCLVHNDRYISFTDNIVFDGSGMEGFQFDLVGVDMVSIPLKDGSLDFDGVTAKPTTLFTGSPRSYFGCAVLPNTREAQMPFADGYVYIYGLRDSGLLTKSLLVARVDPDHLEDFGHYTFFNGTEYVAGIENAAIICEEGGAEMSITPITAGKHAGRYLFLYSNGNVGNRISCRISDSPAGPFSESILLYEIREPENISRFGGQKIYTYNAKAHYHVSSEDSLLISYNVNSQDFESHLKNAEIYRPRLLRLKRIVRAGDKQNTKELV
ncbi:MAG: DUF4185 domain-containing protein [Saccharofermentanales bacterium]